MAPVLDDYRLRDVAAVFNLIQAGCSQGHFTGLYARPRYMAGLGIQLFCLLAGRIRLPDRICYRARARILRIDGQFAGFVILRQQSADETEIYMCALAEEHRGKKLGEWMLKTSLSPMPSGRRIFADCLPRKP